MKMRVIATCCLLLAFPVFADVADYTRTAVENYNGHAGATLVSWVKSTAPLGRAWALKFDMTKGFRLRCHYASTQMPVGTMGAAIAAEGVEWFAVPGSDRRLSGVVDVIAPAGVKSVEGRTDASPQDVGLGVIIH